MDNDNNNNNDNDDNNNNNNNSDNDDNNNNNDRMDYFTPCACMQGNDRVQACNTLVSFVCHAIQSQELLYHKKPT